jgi:hypothetical protein
MDYTSTTWMETQINGVGAIQNDTIWKRETQETPPQGGKTNAWHRGSRQDGNKWSTVVEEDVAMRALLH